MGGLTFLDLLKPGLERFGESLALDRHQCVQFTRF
jgi:hypothetical protein